MPLNVGVNELVINVFLGMTFGGSMPNDKIDVSIQTGCKKRDQL